MYTPDGESHSARAHAKVNLALSVGPPLSEGPHRGYHPLCGLSACIDLCDEITLAHADHTGLDIDWAADALCPSPIDWADETDLCWRAIAALENETKRPLPTTIRVRKRIPVGGGLGGGSSDAATTLRLARDLHQLSIPPERLARIGAGLGADVPYFLDEGLDAGLDAGLDDRPPTGAPRPAIVSGIGERCERLDSFSGRLILLLPGFGCPTPEVYRAFDEAPMSLDERRIRDIASLANREGIANVDRDLFNDLRAPAARVRPELAKLIERAQARLHAPVHMSGSGSTLFALRGEHTPDTAQLGERLGVACIPATFA